VGVLVLAPLAYILVALTQPAGDGWSHVAEHLLVRYTIGTAQVTAMTMAWAVLFGVLPAWFVTAFRFPGRRVLTWLLAAPLAVPSYIAAMAWSGALDFTGPVQTTIRAWFGKEAALWVPDIMTVYGVSFVLGSVLYPYGYITTRAVLLRQSATLVEAARCLGAGPTGAFLRVVLPTLRPAIVAGLALVAMETVNDYGAVHLYGVDTFTTGIFKSWLGLGDVGSAVRLSAVLLVLTVAVLGLEQTSRGRRRYDDGGTTRPLATWPLQGPAALGAAALCATPVVVGLGVPVAMLLWWTVDAWATADLDTFAVLAGRSAGLAAVAAAVVVGGSVLLAYATRIARAAWLTSLTSAAGTGYAVPGAVIAVGVFALGSAIDGLVAPAGQLWLAGSVGALVWAYGVRFLAVGLQPIQAGFTRLGERYDHAARTLGAGPLRTLTSVHAPLLRGTLVGAATLVFVDVLKELPLTLILRPFDFETLATHTYQLASEEQVIEAAPSALLLVAFGLVAVAVAQRGLTEDSP
jgi:iron(III) transport system permease protein